MTQRRTTFRVRGIPCGLDADAVLTALNAALLSCGDATGDVLHRIAKVDVVPSCETELTACALIDWKGENDGFLSNLSKDSQEVYQLEVGRDDWTFNRHFFGFTQLYTPPATHPVTADIIAITGLDGHAYGSFASRANLRRMWLRDFLSKDLPHCRTMIYGYNSKLSSRGIDTIMDYGRGFLEELKKIRRTPEVRKRPLFFIAHSFGGIVLAHCLISAALAHGQNDEVVASLYKATYGILFFGTPHRGMMVEDIRKTISDEDNHPRNALLDQIKENSNALISELSRFKNIIGDRRIVSFYEQSQTRTPVKDQESQKRLRSGDFKTAVEVNSAVLQLPDSIEIPLNSDHSSMVKFDSRQDQGYTSALQYLKEFERDAPGVIAARFEMIEILMSLARTRSAPKPSSTVPFRRDDNFVGQEETLSALQNIFEKPKRHNRAAVHGLGGVGKSQIAIEFSYRWREQDPDTWVFWVYASDSTRFEQSFREIASRVELPGHQDPKCDILHLVFQWLSDESNGRWMIVLDNADNTETLFGMESRTSHQHDELRIGQKPLASFLPQTVNGCILVTSRYKLLASNLVLGDDSTLHIESMDESTAMLLFQTIVAVPPDAEGDCRALLRALDFLPLAIVHAATYVKARAPRITIATYLHLHLETEKTKSVLDSPLNDARRDQGLPVSVLATWTISFEQIRRQSSHAAELFSRMTVLDRQAIPDFLFCDEGADRSFEYALAILLDFSLLTADSSGKRFSLHRLVQLASRRWLEARDELWKSQDWCVKRMARVFPTGNYENRVKCRTLLPHADAVLEYVSMENRDWLLCGCNIYSRYAAYWSTLGKYKASEAMNRRALQGREQVLGPLHPDTLLSVGNLASVLDSQGKYEASEAMNRRALQGREQVLGPLHPDTLVSVSNLASVLDSQGKYEASEAMNRRALQGTEQVLGPLHPDTLASVGNLASVLRAQGKYEASEAMNRRALQGTEQVLGPLHPDTLVSVSNLALVLDDQGKYEASEAMNRRALQGTEQVLGPLHPDTLVSVSNLASVLDSQGKYDASEAMNRHALQGREQVLGPLHPRTLVSVGNLALVLHAQGKYEDSEAMHRRALQGREQVLGPLHPDTLLSVGNLASVLRAQGKYEASEAMNRRALQGREQVLGPLHPDTLASVGNLALVLDSQGKYEASEAMNRHALQGREQVLGPLHPDTLGSVSNLARILYAQGKYEASEAMNRRALQDKEQVLGPLHPRTLVSVGNLALVLHAQGKYEDSEAMHRRALQGSEQELGATHPDILMSVWNLAALLRDCNRDQEARSLYKRASSGFKERLGTDHPTTKECARDAGDLLED